MQRLLVSAERQEVGVAERTAGKAIIDRDNAL
jgi:hypothetical protein